MLNCGEQPCIQALSTFFSFLPFLPFKLGLFLGGLAMESLGTGAQGDSGGQGGGQGGARGQGSF